MPLARLAPGTTIDFRKASDEAEPYLGPGFNEPDEKGRLMDTGEAELVFALAPPPAPGHDLELQIDAIGQSIRSGPLPPLTVEVNGQAVATWHPEPGLQTLKAFIPPRVAGADYQLSIRLRVIPPPTSLFVHAPKGSKRLGLTVQGLRILVGPASSF